MKKILISVMSLALVVGLLGAGAMAYFSDVETSGSNTFTAGGLDLKVDLVSSTHCAADGTVLEGPIAFGERDLTNEVFFKWTDIKPGDKGEATISLHVDNDAWARLVALSTANDENGRTEPEKEGNWDTGTRKFSGADTTTGPWSGELPNWLYLTMWRDNNCDNKYNWDDEYLIGKVIGTTVYYENDVLLKDAFCDIFKQESDEWCRIPGYLPKCTTVCIGISWEVDPAAGNEIQSDSVAITLSFEVSQKRNQPTTPYKFMNES